MQIDPSLRHPVEELAEEFVARYRRGERPSVDEYAPKYPDLAGELSQILQALVLMEDIGRSSGASDEGSAAGGALTTLGEYRILREIGRGGMGVVYEAEQESLARHVALKVLPTLLHMDATRLERFRREARTAARLHHTNIVPVYGVGEHSGTLYYAMQYIPGQGLDRVLEDVKQLRETRGQRNGDPATKAGSSATLLEGAGYYRNVARIGLQVAEALAHAHGQNVLHRDVKLSNVLFDAQGIAWLTDFGLAQADDQEPLTHTGDVVGTLRYMAPERFKGQTDARSDIYGLGTTLYEMLTLSPAFVDSDRQQLVKKILHEEPPRPRHRDQHIPRDLETIVLKAMAKEPRDRYTSAAALADDLRQFLANLPVLARRVSALGRAGRWARRNPVVAGAVSLAVAALLVALIVTGVYNYRLHRAAARADQNAVAEKAARERAVANLKKAYAVVERFWIESGWEETDSIPDNDGIARKKLDGALAFYEDFLTEESNNPALEREVGLAWARIGLIRYVKRDLGSSETAFRHAIAVMTRVTEADPGDWDSRDHFAGVYSDFGLLLRDQHRDRDAEAAFREAIRLSQGLIAEAPDHSKYCEILAKATNNLGRQLHQAKRYTEAVEAFQQSLAIVNALPESQNPGLTSQKHWLTKIHFNLGVTYLDLNRLPESEAATRQAIPIRRQFHATYPRVTMFTRELASALHSLGDVLEHQRQFAKAEAPLREAQQLRKQLADSSPAVSAHQQELAATSTSLARVLRALRRNDDAAATDADSIARIEALVKEYADNPEYWHDLGGVLNNLATQRLGEGKAAEAKKLLERAELMQRKALALRPGDAGFLNFLRNHLLNRTLALLALRDHAAAVRSAEEASALRPDATDAAIAARFVARCIPLAEKDQELPPERRSELATQYADRSVKLLATAVQRGFRDADGVRKNDAFKPLAARADFQELLKAMAATSKTAPPANSKSDEP